MPVPIPPHRWLIPVLVVVVSLIVGGGLLAREVYRTPDARTDTMLALPSSTPRPLAQQPGSGTVELTPDAALHPEHEAVRQLLQTYFDAINSLDYEQWKTAVTRTRIQAKPRADWLKDYASTKDGSILVYRIDAVTDQDLRALVGFTRVQDPAKAPDDLPGASCVLWRLVLPLTQEAGHWLVDSVASYTTPEATRC